MTVHQIHEDTLYFNWFGVSPRFKKQGIGQGLLEAVLKEARINKVKIIELQTRNRFTPAICLYLKNGFYIEGTYLHRDNELMIILRKRK